MKMLFSWTLDESRLNKQTSLETFWGTHLNVLSILLRKLWIDEESEGAFSFHLKLFTLYFLWLQSSLVGDCNRWQSDVFDCFLTEKTGTSLTEKQQITQSEAADTVGTKEADCWKHKTLLQLKIQNWYVWQK